MWIICLTDMARCFEFVLHFVKCDMPTTDTVTLSPNKIIIILIGNAMSPSGKFVRGILASLFRVI